MIEPGSIVWVWAGEKQRPGVLLRWNNQGRGVVIYGTKTARLDRSHERVNTDTPPGRALGLTVTTYFTSTRSWS